MIGRFRAIGAGSGRRLLAGTAAAGALVYSLWVVEWWVNPGLDPWQSYVSELSARDQPGSGIFATADLSSALVLTLLAAAAMGLLPRAPWAVAGWLLQLAFGVVSVADAVCRLDCAPSASTSCSLHERAGFVSLDHKTHTFTSTIAIVLLIASMVCLTVAARRYGWGRRQLLLSGLLLVVQMIAAVLTLCLAVGGTGEGVAERVQVGSATAWFLLVASLLWSPR
jgi:hypothetical protein